jgi:hypothetical protein
VQSSELFFDVFQCLQADCSCQRRLVTRTKTPMGPHFVYVTTKTSPWASCSECRCLDCTRVCCESSVV